MTTERLPAAMLLVQQAIGELHQHKPNLAAVAETLERVRDLLRELESDPLLGDDGADTTVGDDN